MNRSLAAAACDRSVELTTFSPASLRARASKPFSMIWLSSLFLGIQEGDGADFVQVLSNRIAHDKLIQGKPAQGRSEAVGSGGEAGTVSALWISARISAAQPGYCAHKVTRQ